MEKSKSKKIKNYLKRAQKEKWALGQFNFSTLEIIRAITLTAKKLQSPVIVGTSENECKFLGLKQIIALVNTFKEELQIPIFLNLDHGKSLDLLEKSIKLGYDMVHFDGSKLPLKENIKITKEIVKMAHKKGVLVEGEVGAIQSVRDFSKIKNSLTKPESAQRFIKETEVDLLAINIGNLHGVSKTGENPPLNLQRLEEIKEKVKNIPLVLHGGSGTLEKDIKTAINLGIVKVNINTELRLAFTENLRRILKESKEFIPYKYLPVAIVAVQKVVEKKIKLFKSQNKIKI